MRFDLGNSNAWITRITVDKEKKRQRGKEDESSLRLRLGVHKRMKWNNHKGMELN